MFLHLFSIFGYWEQRELILILVIFIIFFSMGRPEISSAMYFILLLSDV